MDTRNLEKVIKLRHTLHEHPELSNHETWTKQTLMRFLKEHTSLEIIDRKEWFYAVYQAKNPKKKIAFRTDIDAIAMDEGIQLSYGSTCMGISHKCGHDGHASALAGLALEIDQLGSENSIYFIFQHAEETGDGAKVCASLIKEEQIDEIYAFHNMSELPLNSVHVIDGTAHFASMGMVIELEGKPSHASAPEMGINPSFAIASLIQQIQHMTSSHDYKGDVFCTIVHVTIGERAFGISPSKGELLLTLRALYEHEMFNLKERLEDLAVKEANKYGLKIKINYQDIFPETVNHNECNNHIRSVCKEKELLVMDLKKPYRASEDFGYYLKETKGAIFYIGNGENYPNIHTEQYNFNDEIIKTAVEVFKGLCI